eukprot:7014483-Karenia_brevis.AAC.1
MENFPSCNMDSAGLSDNLVRMYDSWDQGCFSQNVCALGKLHAFSSLALDMVTWSSLSVDSCGAYLRNNDSDGVLIDEFHLYTDGSHGEDGTG